MFSFSTLSGVDRIVCISAFLRVSTSPYSDSHFAHRDQDNLWRCKTPPRCHAFVCSSSKPRSVSFVASATAASGFLLSASAFDFFVERFFRSFGGGRIHEAKKIMGRERKKARRDYPSERRIYPNATRETFTKSVDFQ